MKICCPHCSHEFLNIHPTSSNQRKKANIVQTMVIINLCANYFDVTYAQVTGKSRKANVVRARHSAFWLLYKWGYLNNCEVGRLLNRDHTSVLFGRKRVDDSLFTKTDLFEAITILDHEVEKYLNPSKQLKATA